LDCVSKFIDDFVGILTLWFVSFTSKKWGTRASEEYDLL